MSFARIACAGGDAPIVAHDAPRARACSVCGVKTRRYRLCDYRIVNRKLKTCDAPLCTACAVHREPDTDYCPLHAAGERREAEAVNMHSLHFSPIPEDPKKLGKPGKTRERTHASKIAPAPQINVLDVLGQAQTEAHLVATKLAGLVKAGNGRHGDLQVTLSALRRLDPLVAALIAAEEAP